MIGGKYGNMTVLNLVEERSSNCSFQALCRCDCGIEKVAALNYLLSGATKSCGCLGGIPNRKKQITHGHWQKGAYNSWANAKRRCNNPKNPRYHQYGGRGIKVCSRWDTFEQFLADMGERPTSKHSLDRINVDGDYSPENCRWATNVEQCNNTRRNVYLVLDGKRKTAADWSRSYGINYMAIAGRIKLGWTVRDTLTVPVGGKRA